MGLCLDPSFELAVSEYGKTINGGTNLVKGDFRLKSLDEIICDGDEVALFITIIPGKKMGEGKGRMPWPSWHKDHGMGGKTPRECIESFWQIAAVRAPVNQNKETCPA